MTVKNKQEMVQSVKKPNIVFRVLAIAYALFAYGVGSAALFWFFFALTGLAPYSLSEFKTDNRLPP